MKACFRVRQVAALVSAALMAGAYSSHSAAESSEAEKAAQSSPNATVGQGDKIVQALAGEKVAQAGPGAPPGTSTAGAAPQVEKVIVTGSRIRGGAETAALPVRVITAEDIANKGSPNMVEFLKSIPESAGVMGDSNQFSPGRGQGFEGSGSVNLRGLGPDRTLVLLNGKRMPLVSSYIVNTFNLPISAIERVEVLRDGAASSYGSDAIGGVVNFITKRNFKGLELGGSFRGIKGSDGDYDVDATWGTSGSNWSAMVSAGFQHRSELRVLDRAWAPAPYEINPNAGWSFSVNPSQFIPVGLVGPNGTLAATGARAVDVGCLRLGGIMPFAGFCTQQFTVWENLVEEQNSAQVFGEFNKGLGGNTKLNVEVALAKTRVPHLGYPPSFNQPKPITETVLPTNINPATFVAGTTPRLFNNWFVPITNPGVAAYAAANPSQFPAGTTGIFIPIGQYRPYFVGGNPMFGYGGGYGVREQDQVRVSAGLTGEFRSGMNWDFNASYGRNEHYLAGRDTPGVYVELALRGLGGPNCDFRTGTPGVGPCMWLNPMSNAIPGAPLHGVAVNPGYVPAVANTAELAQWLMQHQESWLKSEIYEVNGVLTGDIPQWRLAGGEVSWVAGTQFRRNEYHTRYSRYADRTQVPCLNSPLNIPGADNCTPTPNTPLGLAVANNPLDETADVIAAFGEVNLPFTQRHGLNFAARYEDYGSKGGSTFNPQLRGKIEVTNFLAFRGSAGTTFRAPPQSLLAPDPATTNQAILGTFRAADLVGNPDLKPEKAKTFNFGAILVAGGFDAALDYYHYIFEDIITTEPLNPIVNALFPNGATGANNCATTSSGFIASHFVFAGPCSASNLTRVLLLRINGPKAKINGFDFRASYRMRNILGGDVQVGMVGNRIREYKFDAFEVAGVAIAGFDGVGMLNVGTLAHPLPRLKGEVYLNYNRRGINARWTARGNSRYADQRTTPAIYGYNIPGIVLHDFALVFDGPFKTKITAAVTNVFDKDPSFTRTEYSYDPLTGDPLGRTFKLGLRYRF